MSGPPALVRAAELAGVRDPRVLDALRRVLRAGFVPPEHVASADTDEPIPIPHRQVTTQPSLSARMLEGLHLAGAECALEIGTGYGFQTALLAQLADEVWSIERYPDLAKAARENLAADGIRNVHVLVADGSEGWPEAAPFDAIVVSAAFPEVPEPLIAQLGFGGRLVQPIGSGGDEEVAVFTRTASGIERTATLGVARFVRLVGRYGFSADA